MKLRQFISALEEFAKTRPGTLEHEVVVRNIKADWIPAAGFAYGFGRVYIEEALCQPYDRSMDLTTDDFAELRRH